MSSPDYTIPPDELYWAVLNHEQVGRAAHTGSKPLRDAPMLDELFAEAVPVPFETVKPAYVTLDASRVLAVAAPRDRLAAAANAIAARPTNAPAHLAGDSEIARLIPHLNLLWGDLEPRPVTAAKRRAAATAAATLLLVASIALLGIERRTAALRSSANEHRALTQAALKDLYPKAATPDAAASSLDQELARLTRTRTARTTVDRDAADALESLLAAWPRTADTTGAPKLRTESLTATPESLTLTVALDDRAGVTPLSDSLRAIAGWRLTQPQFTAGGSQAQATSPNAGTLSLRLAAENVGEKGGGR